MKAETFTVGFLISPMTYKKPAIRILSKSVVFLFVRALSQSVACKDQSMQTSKHVTFLFRARNFSVCKYSARFVKV